MASLNSCSFIGHLGKDPEIRSTQGGDKCANLSIACTEKWKTQSGEAKERTTWVPIVIWEPLAGVAEKYLRKGSKVYVSGKFTVRKWSDSSGNDRYSTEIVLQGPGAQLIMLDGASSGSEGRSTGRRQSGAGSDDWGGTCGDALDDDIGF